ncbi:MAG: response regulator transcription factor [Proteobacteria bacterium]|nr:response regulator transcription factor [Pseudomonadota bacterium]
MEQSHTVLAVDSDASGREAIRASLAGIGLRVLEGEGGETALKLALEHPPDLIVSDLSLPDISGLGFFRMVRETPALADVPIVVVAEQASEIDRILAFEVGVDDFLAKPFFPRELESRVKAILRRLNASTPRMASAQAALTVGDVRVDPAARVATVGGEAVHLTPKEFTILRLLAERAGVVLSREDLIREAWDEDAAITQRVVDAHVKTLRRKLGAAREQLETVRGIGYRLAEG